jgi:uncharacterized membrane protein YhaH (DUF805 family)
MSFGVAVSTCLTKKYAVFTGRAGRPEFWWFMCFGLLVWLATTSVDGLRTGSNAYLDGGGVATLVASLLLFLPQLSVWVRRLHDGDHSGWWLLIGFVPVAGLIVLLIFALQSGTPGPNGFGLPVPGPAVQFPASGSAPIGWYADPYAEARVRWWDGSTWTRETAR